MNIIIDRTQFYITPTDTSVVPQKNAALLNLKRIAEVVRRKLPYSKECQDEFSKLTERELWSLLKKHAACLRDAYPNEDSISQAYKKVKYSINPPPVFPALPEEASRLIFVFLPIKEIGVMARINALAKENAENAFIARARAYGQPDQEAATAKSYLQEALRFIKQLTTEEAFIDLMERQIEEDLEATFRNIQSISAKKPELQTFLGQKLCTVVSAYNGSPAQRVQINVLLLCGARLDFQSENKSSILHSAPEELIPFFLEKGANPNRQDELGRTPLHYARTKQYAKETVAALLSYGADPDIIDKWGSSCVMQNLLHDYTFDSTENIMLMINKGADPNLGDNNNNWPLSEAICRRSVKLTKALLERKANPNIAVCSRKLSLLQLTNKNPKLTALLLHYQANPNSQDSEGNTPLHFGLGNTKIVRLLLNKKADPNLPNNNQEYPLHRAISRKLKKIALLLLKAGAKPNVKDRLGLTPLHLAVISNATKIAFMLIENGAELNVKDNKGLTPLHYSIGNPEIVEFFASKGADLNLPGRENQYLIHLAVENSLESLKILLKYHAKLDVQDSKGKTALHATVIKNNREAISLLLKQQANPDIADNQGHTPLHRAIIHPDIIELLADNHANLNLQDNNGQCALHLAVIADKEKSVRTLLKYNPAVNIQDHLGETPLFKAVCLGRKELVSMLLQAGADPNLADKKGMTPLFLDAVNNEIKELLIDNGADVDHCDQDGNTPLHHAVNNDDEEFVIMLLKHAADPGIVNAQGQRPFQLAQNENIKKMLSVYET